MRKFLGLSLATLACFLTYGCPTQAQQGQVVRVDANPSGITFLMNNTPVPLASATLDFKVTIPANTGSVNLTIVDTGTTGFT